MMEQAARERCLLLLLLLLLLWVLLWVVVVEVGRLFFFVRFFAYKRDYCCMRGVLLLRTLPPR
jgi:hypothetical protein